MADKSNFPEISPFPDQTLAHETGLESILCKGNDHLQSSQGGHSQPDVVISERRDTFIQQLSFFGSQSSSLTKQLAQFGIKSIPDFSQIKLGRQVNVARVEMEKIWLISASPLSDISRAFYPLNLSSARAILRVSGPRAPDLMARLCAVDFRDKSRNFVGTSMHHVGVHIHVQDGVFDIYMPRSFAASLADYIIDIASQYHVQMA